MSKRIKLASFAGAIVLCLGLVGSVSVAEQGQRKTKKPELPPLPAGPTGPVPQIPLDSMAPVAPQVTYQNGELTIIASNSTLGDVLRAVRKQTGAEIEIPTATDRVVTRLGPGPARDVMAELLNGSRFNYVLMSSPQDVRLLTRVVLVAKTGSDNTAAANQPPQQQQPMANQVDTSQLTQEQIDDAETPNPDDNADQAAEAEQTTAPEQPEVKTPQQMLQEMQQRQLQLQQQQQTGQPPVPAPGMPPRPQQQQQ